MADVGILVAQRPVIVAVGGGGGAGTAVAQRPVIESSGFAGVIGSASLEAQRPIVDTVGGREGGVLVAQRPVVRAAGYTGVGGAAAIVAQRPVVEAAGRMSYIDLSYLYWKRHKVTAVGLVGAVGTASLTIKRPRTSVTGYRGVTNATTVRIVAQRPVVSAVGYCAITGSASLLAQRPVIALQFDNASEAWISFAMNAVHGAVTEYDQYQFNSFARLGDRILAASDSGVFALEGDDDEGSEIDATIKSGRYDFNSPLRKVATDVYGAYSCDKDMTFNVFHKGTKYSFRMPRRVDDDVVMHKANLGQGLRSNFHQYGIGNRSGAGFTLTGFTVLVDVLSSRV